MLRGRDVEEVVELKRQGLSIRAISRLTGYDRTTISKYLSAPAGRPAYGPRIPVKSKLEPFKTHLKERLQAGVWNARVLMRELRERGFDGGYTILTDWLRPQRKEAESLAVRRFETPPGKQAQVDWGHLGTLSDGDGERKLWVFTMTLGYSRRMFAAAATDQKLGTLLRMHKSAFYEWGAVPDEILYDRMKTVWTGIDERGEPPYLNGAPMEIEGSLPLGILENLDCSVLTFQVSPSDRLLLLSDGIAEATNEQGGLFGFVRVLELVRTDPSAQKIAEAAQSFGQEDDISVISITRVPLAHPAAQPALA